MSTPALYRLPQTDGDTAAGEAERNFTRKRKGSDSAAAGCVSTGLISRETALAVVKGASVPYPYGGKPRVIMVDLDLNALQSRGMTPSEVTTALQNQNLIAPSGDVGA